MIKVIAIALVYVALHVNLISNYNSIFTLQAMAFVHMGGFVTLMIVVFKQSILIEKATCKMCELCQENKRLKSEEKSNV